MRDLALVGFLVLMFAFAVKRPFLFVLAYVYIDIVSPQRLSYYLINQIPISQIFFIAAFLGWLFAEKKDGLRVAPRQWMMGLLLVWAGLTTFTADFPVEALEKWDWVWPGLVFAIFLPFTLTTRLRLEALLLVMILSASSIIITGGIKTVLAGGGYGVLALGVDNNSGLYEGSIISILAVAIIPLILYLRRFGTIFPTDWRVNLFAAALIFACLLIPIGTEARTGLICIAVLAMLMLRDTKRRLIYIFMTGAAAAVAVPLLPSSFSQRMDTIQTYQADESASTRIAVWKWTWDYVQVHPLGGGFEAYRQNQLRFETVGSRQVGNVGTIVTGTQTDTARAYHSSYFEMLGEQGWPGFILWILLHLIGLIRMEQIRRRFRRAVGDEAWIPKFATGLQCAHLIYLVGSLFVGIAFQSFAFMWMGLEIGLDRHCARLRGAETGKPRMGQRPAAAATV